MRTPLPRWIIFDRLAMSELCPLLSRQRSNRGRLTALLWGETLTCKRCPRARLGCGSELIRSEKLNADMGVMMKYMLSWTERPQGSPIEYENAQKRILELFTQWKAPGNFKIELFVVRVGDWGGANSTLPRILQCNATS
jgi:hypothetical protein